MAQLEAVVTIRETDHRGRVIYEVTATATPSVFNSDLADMAGSAVVNANRTVQRSVAAEAQHRLGRD